MIRKNPTHKPKNLKKWSYNATTCHNVKMRHSRKKTSLETEMRERVKRGESLDSIMEELSHIANKLEAEKKNNPRKDYIKELENKYIENAILPNASRNLEIASIIMTLDIAEKVPEATRKDLE